MTGKTRMLGAGCAGSTAYGSNVNLGEGTEPKRTYIDEIDEKLVGGLLGNY
tara:strand:- start:62 stop:214 length:153 start_codon:yes stop_codon:yes gene_type:complete